VYSSNVATLWGNNLATDVCRLVFAAPLPATVQSGVAVRDINSAIPVLIASDYYGATVQAENALKVVVAEPISQPATSSYYFKCSNVTMASGRAVLTDLVLGAQPRSAFAFTATAASNSTTGTLRTFTTSFTVHTQNCQPGTYRELSTVNATLVYTCLPCPIGTYGDLIESPSCKTCTAGNYCAVGSAVQTVCPARYTSSIGSGTCICDVDYVGMTSVTGCNPSADLPYGTVDCPTDGSAVLTIHGDNFGTGALAISVGGRECVVLSAVMDMSVKNQSNTSCVPPSGYAQCQLPAGTGKLQFISLTDTTGSKSQQVASSQYLYLYVSLNSTCSHSANQSVVF
jgi:IPT/TIG domain